MPRDVMAETVETVYKGRMPVVVSGQLAGKSVNATREDNGDVHGDPDLLQAAVAQVKAGAPVDASPALPSASPSLRDPFAFAVTVGSCVDAGTFQVEGLEDSEIPEDEIVPGTPGVVH